MDFVDFLRMVWLLNDLGGDLGMVQTLASVRSGEGMSGKLEEYKRILDAMTPEERSNPDLFERAPPGPSSDRVNQEVAQREAMAEERGGLEAGAVEQFFLEFNVMRGVLAQLGRGTSIEQATSKLLLERTDRESHGKHRALRHKVSKSMSGRKRRKPAWLDV